MTFLWQNVMLGHMSASAKVQFEPKWKEQLICTMDRKTFAVELTMGRLVVYFPTCSAWEASTPKWAKGQWDRVRIDLIEWCEQQKIPLRIQDDAWVVFDSDDYAV